MPSVPENSEPRPGQPLSGHIDLPGSARSAAAARRFVRGLLGTAHPAIDDVALVVSELVTNAVVHSRSGRHGTVRLAVRDADGVVRVEVADEGNAFSAPYVRDEPCAESGRGPRGANSPTERTPAPAPPNRVFGYRRVNTGRERLWSGGLER